MGISTPAQYAVRALVCLAGRSASTTMRVREIADAEGIPYAFLAKLIPQLVQGRLLDSFKGPNGGVRLAILPHSITILNVIECIEGPESLTQCFLGLPACSEVAPCPAHDEWKGIREGLLRRLRAASIADLAVISQSRRQKG